MNARRTIAAGMAAGLAGLAIGLATPAEGALPGPLVSCPELLECAVVSVPLDHADPSTGRLGLVVSHLRPKKGPASSGTLLFLTGDLHDPSRAAFPAAVRAALAGDGTLLARIVGHGQSARLHPTRQSVAT